MLVSFSTQLSAAEISERENSSVTNGPGGGAALRAGTAPAPGARTAPPAADPAAGTSATAAATVTALSRPARLLPACFLPRSVFSVMAHRLGAIHDLAHRKVLRV